MEGKENGERKVWGKSQVIHGSNTYHRGPEYSVKCVYIYAGDEPLMGRFPAVASGQTINLRFYLNTAYEIMKTNVWYAGSEKSRLRNSDAAASGDIRRLRTLLDRGANINGRDDRDYRWGMTPLMCAAEEGHLRDKKLLRRGAKVNLKDRRCFGEGGGYTALHYAISSEHVSIVDILIEAGADVNAVTQDGTGTPLMQAVSKKSKPIVDLLLKAGADPNVVEKVVGQTALRIAAQRGDDTLIRILIKNGAKVDITDEDDTPLIRALWQKHFSSAELLLKDGADPNFPGHDGFTPLMWAVMSGYDGIVRKLIAAGADLNVRNDNGHTALDIALREGNREVAAILEQAGARTSDHLPAAGAKKKLRTPRLEWRYRT